MDGEISAEVSSKMEVPTERELLTEDEFASEIKSLS